MLSPIDGKTRVCGLIGDPVDHSLSPLLHNGAYRELGLPYCYVPFPVKPARLKDAVRGALALSIAGLNVTAPYKEAVAPLLDELDETAAAIGAVNTICNRDGRLVGYNTDGGGFLWFLREIIRWEPDPEGTVAVLGAGGAARAVAFALAGAGVPEFVFLNRTRRRGEQLAAFLRRRFPGVRAEVAPLEPEILPQYGSRLSLLVNTLPAEPWPWEAVPLPSPELLVCDLRYYPRITPFLQWARGGGARACNGLGMLAGQAALSFAIFTGAPPPFTLMYRLIRGEPGLNV